MNGVHIFFLPICMFVPNERLNDWLSFCFALPGVVFLPVRVEKNRKHFERVFVLNDKL